MACLEDLSLTHRLFLQTYRYRSGGWEPGARLAKPLIECRIALISTAGLHLSSQPPFDQGFKGGDCSFRELPSDTEIQKLQISHRSSDFDRRGAEEDMNVVFPLDRIREAAQARQIGSLNHRHFAFMGSITAPGRLIAESAPQVAELLRRDQVDAAFLTPAWPMCHQSVGLIAAAIERAGIATVSLSVLREITEKVRPPRSLIVPFSLGYPVGEPRKVRLQHRVIRAALSLLESPEPLPLLRDFEAC